MQMAQEYIFASARAAMKNREFAVYYQPQYNHSTKELIGAEALVRWNNPVYGLQSPAVFIPALEACGLITELDLYVFDEVCRFIIRCKQNAVPVVPISFNISMRDVQTSDFVDRLETIRTSNGVAVDLIRVEITESCVATNLKTVQDTVSRLHALGYIVEMDDFGNGYSSLHALKDVEFDVIKLDMSFLQGKIGGRGGTIVSSMVYMCRWLNTPLIAEGVETAETADYMRSLGCEYVQGYLYSRPVPEDDYVRLLKEHYTGILSTGNKVINTLNPERFWSPESLDTLIFSDYVGGAAIISLNDDRLSFIRINRKYLREIGMGHTESELFAANFSDVLDEQNLGIYISMLKKAVESGDEEECETWRSYESHCCGAERLRIRTSARMLCSFGRQYIFHVQIRNITSETKRFEELRNNDEKLMRAGDIVNLYAWEYIIAAREMHPCFRCMRDLQLPAVISDYPEYAVASGLFPPEYAEVMRRVESGEDGIDVVLPLTYSKIPFRIRYSIERDASGTPVKAYGSAVIAENAR